jgi:hypothetical protein
MVSLPQLWNSQAQRLRQLGHRLVRKVQQWIPALLNLAAGHTDPGPLASFMARFKDAGQRRPKGPDPCSNCW